MHVHFWSPTLPETNPPRHNLGAWLLLHNICPIFCTRQLLEHTATLPTFIWSQCSHRTVYNYGMTHLTFLSECWPLCAVFLVYADWSHGHQKGCASASPSSVICTSIMELSDGQGSMEWTKKTFHVTAI